MINVQKSAVRGAPEREGGREGGRDGGTVTFILSYASQIDVNRGRNRIYIHNRLKDLELDTTKVKNK